MLKIVSAPNKVLTLPSKEVKTIDKKILRLVIEMEEALLAQRDPQGVGLAAPQVGINIRLYIVKANPKAQTQVFINPKILETEGLPAKDTEERFEGCLSIPRIWAPLKRAQKVKVEYLDMEGVKHTKWFTGFNATVALHEVDHLEGILFTQRCLEQNISLYEEKGDKLQKLKSL